MKQILLVILFVLTASGCVGTSAVMINSSRTYPPTDNITILFKEPDQAYEIIAIIEGNGTVFNNQSQILKEMQVKAQKIGAHAIIPLTADTQYIPDKYIQNIDGSPLLLPGGNKITMKAVAIRYKFAQTKSTKSQHKGTVLPQNPYRVHRKISAWGLASTALTTMAGSLAMEDEFYKTTIIPIIGPFVTIVRVENDPNAYYHPGGKPLLIASGVVQTGFLIYFIASWAGEQTYNAKFSILPASHLVGVTMRYRF